MAKRPPGHAVYFEFHNKDGYISQLLFIGPQVTVSGKYLPAQIRRRLVSENQPQMQWTPTVVAVPDESLPDINTFDGIFTKQMRPEYAMERALEQWSQLDNFVTLMSNVQWTFYKTPLIVEVSALDVKDLEKGQTPKKIIDRVSRVRSENGFIDLPKRKTTV